MTQKKTRVAVMLLTINRVDITNQTLLRAFAHKGDDVEIDLYVWDNGSTTPAIHDVVKNFKPVFHHIHDGNFGTAQSLNQMRMAAKDHHDYEYYAFIGNDILLPKNWLSANISIAKKINNPGVMGWHCVMSGGAPVVVNGYKVRKSKRVFGSVCWTKAVNESIGAFAEDLGVYGLWDSDFHERVHRLGYVNFYHPKLKSQHIGGRDDKGAYRQMKNKSMKKAMSKIGAKIRQYAKLENLKQPFPEKVYQPKDFIK